MKIFSVQPLVKGALGLFLLSGGAAFGQLPGAAGPTGVNAAMLKLFGGVEAFTARAEVQMLDGSKQEIVSMPMDFALLDKKIRIKIDMTQTRNKNMPAGVADTLTKMGMAQVETIVRPDKKLAYVLYPGQKVMLTMPMTKEETLAAEAAPQITRTAVGKETIDGHPCVKNKVTITDDKGQKMELTTWEATDLKDFPVQIQTQEKENTAIMRFKQVKFTKLDPQQFEPPAGYTTYDNPQEMMSGMMQRMMEKKDDK